MSSAKMKSLVVLERLFGGIFNALTLGVLFVYLVSIGSGVEGISVVVGASALTNLFIHIMFYKYPRLLVTKIRPKYIILHLLERILFIFIPLANDYRVVALILAAVAATPTNTYMNLTIYGSFSENDIRDVTAKRTATAGMASIIGFGLAMLLLAFMPPETKFLYIYALGVAIGLISTIIVAAMDLSHLEGMGVPKRVEQPEKLFSTSSYFVLILAGGSLLSIVWVPYLMDYLKGPDYLAVGMNLVTTLTSIFASLVFKGWPFNKLRYIIGLDPATPVLALATPIPVAHLFLSAYSSLTYTGSNFVGSFLFARYNQWLGAIRSSLLSLLVLSLAQVLVSPIGMLFRDDYPLIFLIAFGIKLLAFLLALTTIPEAAIVREETARSYSSLMYDRSLTGYRISVELSKDTILLTLRLIGLSVVLLTLYVIYRLLFLMVNWK